MVAIEATAERRAGVALVSAVVTNGRTARMRDANEPPSVRTVPATLEGRASACDGRAGNEGVAGP